VSGAGPSFEVRGLDSSAIVAVSFGLLPRELAGAQVRTASQESQKDWPGVVGVPHSGQAWGPLPLVSAFWLVNCQVLSRTVTWTV
jgi:hypothetical protein